MKRTTKYVALDVHQATTVAAVREPGGRVIARSILPTEATALVEFFRGMRGSIHVAFEEGTQAQWLYDLLAPVVDRVIVCDRRGEHRGNKADQADADKLSQRLLNGDLRAVYHGSTDRLTLQVPASGPRRRMPSSMCCAGCGPGPRLSWFSRPGAIRPGRCCVRFPSWARSGCRCSWPP